MRIIFIIIFTGTRIHIHTRIRTHIIILIHIPQLATSVGRVTPIKHMQHASMLIMHNGVEAKVLVIILLDACKYRTDYDFDNDYDSEINSAYSSSLSSSWFHVICGRNATDTPTAIWLFV